MTFGDEVDCLHPFLTGASLVVTWNILSTDVAYTISSWLLLKFSRVQCSPCATAKSLNWTSPPVLIYYVSTWVF